MKATVTLNVAANCPPDWDEMYGGEQEARAAFIDFVNSFVSRIGGGCEASMVAFVWEADQ